MASRTVAVTLAVSRPRHIRCDVCRGHGEKNGPHVVEQNLKRGITFLRHLPIFLQWRVHFWVCTCSRRPRLTLPRGHSMHAGIPTLEHSDWESMQVRLVSFQMRGLNSCLNCLSAKVWRLLPSPLYAGRILCWA